MMITLKRVRIQLIKHYVSQIGHSIYIPGNLSSLKASDTAFLKCISLSESCTYDPPYRIRLEFVGDDRLVKAFFIASLNAISRLSRRSSSLLKRIAIARSSAKNPSSAALRASPMSLYTCCSLARSRTRATAKASSLASSLKTGDIFDLLLSTVVDSEILLS